MKIDRTTIAFHAAERILDELESAGFNYTNPSDIIDAAYSCRLSEGIHIASGASRLVLWDDQCDYVIKIALQEEYERYNEHEVEVYQAVIKEGLEDNFGWCACYIPPCVNDYSYCAGIYVMEYLEGNEEEVSDSAWDYGYKLYCSERGLDSSSYEYADDYNDWCWNDERNNLIDLFFSQLGNKVSEMSKFISDFHINDLHSGNYLFRNNRLVICDYGGWGW